MKLHAVLAAAALSLTASGIVYAKEPDSTTPPTGPTTTPSTPAPSGLRLELTSLRLMHENHLITDEQYASALHDLEEVAGSRAPDGTTFLVGKVATTFYGFIELDTAYDSTQSFSDIGANSPVARAETYQGSHGRGQFSIRDSRFGFRIQPPALGSIRTSANLEMDFYGTPASLPVNTNGTDTITEAAFYVNPALRVRHAYFKIETPYVDLMFGQYWNLYGWQPYYFPNTIDLQGLPGQIFSRSPQIRLSKKVTAGPISVEGALAASRPAMRDTAMPDGQAGLRLTVDGWKGLQTVYAPSTVEAPASLALSGIVRRMEVPEFTESPTKVHTTTGGGGAVDAFIPVIPATKANADNGLSLMGEFAIGAGTNDLYTSLSGGVSNPALPNPTGKSPAPTYSPDFDPGLAVYASDGTLHLIQWQSYLIGAQYYFPYTNGRLWLSGNYSHLTSPNSSSYGAPTKVKIGEDWVGFSVWGDVTQQIRLGVGYSNYNDQYADSHHAVNHHLGFNAFFVF